MRALLLLCVAAVSLSAVSCSSVPTPHGRANFAGGKRVIKYNADGSFVMAENLEKSFGQVLTTAATLGTGYFLNESVQAAAAVKNVAAREATKQTGIKTAGAVKTATVQAQGAAVDTAAGAGAEFAPVIVKAPGT